jgi:hypothetical protein
MRTAHLRDYKGQPQQTAERRLGRRTNVTGAGGCLLVLPPAWHGQGFYQSGSFLTLYLDVGLFQFDLRRGLCFDDTDLITSLLVPVAGKGTLDLAMAAAIRPSTSGRANVSADSTRIKRV